VEFCRIAVLLWTFYPTEKSEGQVKKWLHDLKKGVGCDDEKRKEENKRKRFSELLGLKAREGKTCS